MLVWDNPVAIGKWVEDHGGGYNYPGSYSAIGYVQGGDLVGALTFHTCNKVNCFVNIALTKPFPRPLLRAGLWYVFHQLTLKRLTFLIDSANIKSQNLVVRLGSKREATLHGASPNGDLFIYSLFPADCYIWSRLDGQKCIHPASAGPGRNHSAANCGE